MCDSLQPRGLYSTRLVSLWNSPGRNNAVHGQSLFQGIFLTQGLNLGLMHCRQMVYHLSHQVRCKTCYCSRIYVIYIIYICNFSNVLFFLLIQFTMNVAINKNLLKKDIKLFYYKYIFQFYFLYD